MPAPKPTVSGVLGAVLGMLGLSALSGLLVTVMVAPAIAVTGVSASSTVGIFDSLPDYLELDLGHQKNTIAVIGKGGAVVPVATVYDQNREEVPLAEISPYLQHAAIDGEDERFMDHGGVDVPSVVRAAIGNITGTSDSGASTLEMQTVRNIIQEQILNDTSLTDDQRTQQLQAALAPDPARKIQEMKYAIGLEKRYTKPQLLEAYLNIANFGGNTYGVQAAAQEYFGVAASDLTVAQAASLMAIVQYPGTRDLANPDHFANNQARRDYIIGKMFDNGDITQQQRDEALATPVDANFVHYSPPTNGCLAAAAAYRFPCDYATRLVPQLDALGSTPEERQQKWASGGYTLITTISPTLQGTATTATKTWAPPKGLPFNLGAAATSVKVGDGAILVMAENKTFNNTEKGGGAGTTAVNFNVDQSMGGSVGFQPGSSYKPYVLLAFLNAGHGLNETFNAGVLKLDQSKFSESCGGGFGGTYSFHNDENEKGLWTVLRATANSVNSVFLQMATLLDQCDIEKMAQSLGVHDGNGSTDLATDPSCAIGVCANNLTPLTQAAAYAGIANNGTYCAPYMIKSVIDPTGATLPGQQKNCSQSLASPSVAHTAAYAMAGVLASGTATLSNPHDGTEYIGKTGTTDDAVHTWMVGTSSRVATAVWVGNVKGHNTLRQLSINGVNGWYVRHYIFRTIALAVDKIFPGKNFPAPDASLLTGSPVIVPDGILGSTPEQAKAVITLAQLYFHNAGKTPSDAPVGTIVKMSPQSGATVPRGSQVSVWTSDGDGAIAPDVTSTPTSFGDAQAAFNSAGFSIVNEACKVPAPTDPPVPDGTVIAQKPKAGAWADKSRAVTLTVSRAVCP